MKTWIKGIGFSLVLNFMAAVPVVFCLEGLIKDIISLLLVLLLLAVSIPFYFLVKRKCEKPPVYLGVSLVSHSLFSIGVCFAASLVYNEVDMNAFYWLEVFLAVYFILIAFIDVLLTLNGMKKTKNLHGGKK